MNSIQERLLRLGLHVPDILLPSPSVDLSKWSVIACDQFTSNAEYWKRVEEYVGDSPSTFRTTLPEIYLNDGDVEKRIRDIRRTVSSYLDAGLLSERPVTSVLVERRTPFSPVRTGLVIAVDLEKYDFTPGTGSLIRATEGTILDRLPPREKVRSASPAEFSHVMVLLDDPANSVLGALKDSIEPDAPLYDFELMMNGGHIRGYGIDSPDVLGTFASSLENLYGELRKKSVGGTDPLMFAVGDGNHSLAAAKAVWEKVKRSTGEALHAARFALVELLNLYDPGLVFHPIHRVIFNVRPAELLGRISDRYGADVLIADGTRPPAEDISSTGDLHSIGFVSEESCGLLRLNDPDRLTAAGALQEILDSFLKDHTECTIDYVHGVDEVTALSSKKGTLGFLLPATKKESLFPAIGERGILPRKAFSIGEAVEKRYYLEGRRIML